MLRTKYVVASDSFTDDTIVCSPEEEALAASFKEALDQYQDGLINSVELFRKLVWEASKVEWADQTADDILAHWSLTPNGVPVQSTHEVLASVKPEVRANLANALNNGWVKLDFSAGWPNG